MLIQPLDLDKKSLDKTWFGRCCFDELEGRMYEYGLAANICP